MFDTPVACRICGDPVPRTGFPRYYCCNGRDCGCGGGTLPDSVCSSSCFEDEDLHCPLEQLEDDEWFAGLIEDVRSERVARGFNPDTGLPVQPTVKLCAT